MDAYRSSHCSRSGVCPNLRCGTYFGQARKADQSQQPRRQRRPMSIRRVISLSSMLAALCALSIASAAFAQSASPAQDVYSPKSEVLNVVSGGGPADIVPGEAAGQGNAAPAAPVTHESGGSTPVAAPAGSLPFTGFQAGLVALAGLALLGTGVAMRRVSRSNS